MLIITIPIGLKYEESIITFIPVIVWGVLMLSSLAVTIIWGDKLNKRFIEENAQRLDKELYDISLDEAVSKLKERGIAASKGFLVNDTDTAKKRILELDYADIYFYGEFVLSKFSFGFFVVDRI